MKVDTTNPFMVQEWIRRSITEARTSVANDLATVEQRLEGREVVVRMERSLMSLNGICSLHVDNLYNDELGRIAWWKFRKRRAFEWAMIDWKRMKRGELVAEAAAVESLEP